MKIVVKRYMWMALVLAMLSPSTMASSKDRIPEPFRGDAPSSQYRIDYSDIDLILNAFVLNTGRSNRSKPKPGKAVIGSRIRISMNRLTADEANRFYFESFDSDDKKQIITKIRNSLESLPETAPLSQFNKSEQLAYWLNLHNITMLDEILKIYPEKDLEDQFDGRNGINTRKILNVSGVSLSLDDIHHNILMPKFDNNPLIIYGLYQGYIGGPNIRKQAFTGQNVFKNLRANASEFINSNRGTYWDEGKKEFRVSHLYARNEDYFKNFKADVKEHVYKYLSGDLKDILASSRKIRANIANWRVADLYGSVRDDANSTSTNHAALLGANSNESTTIPFFGLNEVQEGPGVLTFASFESATQKLLQSYGRFSEEQIKHLQKLNQKRLEDPGTVTVKDLDSSDNQ